MTQQTPVNMDFAVYPASAAAGTWAWFARAGAQGEEDSGVEANEAAAIAACNAACIVIINAIVV